MNSPRFLTALLRTNLRAAYAMRGSFWLQVLLMAANNLVFFAIWPIFFRRFRTLGGWELADVAAMYGVVSTAYGLVTVLTGGYRNLAQTIAEGDLDTYLTLPKPVLPHLLGSRSIPSGFGDIATGIVMLAACGRVDAASLPLAVLVVTAAALIYLCANVTVHAAAFWLGPVQGTVRTFADYIVMLSMYPQTIYGGALKALMFTLVPAGFIGWLPVEILRQPSAGQILALVAGAAAWTMVAGLVFQAGLRRYASGSRFGVRL